MMSLKNGGGQDEIFMRRVVELDALGTFSAPVSDPQFVAPSLPVSQIILQERFTEQESDCRIDVSLTFSLLILCFYFQFLILSLLGQSIRYPPHLQSHTIPFNLLNAHPDSFLFA
jgi:hypothetical protein